MVHPYVYSVNIIMYYFSMNDYHHGNLKQQLLDEGLRLLTEEGFEKFSLRKLARRCNVSHTSPYRHFSDKNELILAIAREIQSKFNSALKEALDNSTESPAERVKAMGRGYVHFFLENPDYLELLFLSPELQKMSCGKHDHSEGSSFETYISAILPLLSDEKKSDFPLSYEGLDGRIPGEALRPWCLIHGLTVLLAKGAIPITDKHAINRLIDEVLDI